VDVRRLASAADGAFKSLFESLHSSRAFSKFYRPLRSLHKEFQKAFKRAPENLLTAFEKTLKVFGKPLKGL